MKIQSEILNEVVTVVPQTLSIQSMQEAVPGPVCHTAAPVRLATLAILVALATECSLVDLALCSSAEGHSIVLQLNDSCWGLFGHVVNGVLVSQPIGPLDGVVHVPPPVVGLHVPEGGVDASLCSHSV